MEKKKETTGSRTKEKHTRDGHQGNKSREGIVGRRDADWPNKRW